MGEHPRLAGVEYPLRPMIAVTAGQLPLDRPGGWAFEPKFDGFRCIAFRSRDRVALQSRQQRPLGRYFPEIVAAVDQLGVSVVLDGELVICHDGRLDFAALQRRLHPSAARVRQLSLALPACFVIFDLLARGGVDLRARPYRKRRRALEKLLHRRLPAGLVLMPMSSEVAVAEAWMVDHCAAGIEGVVAKRLDETYRPGGRTWRKIRTRTTAEAVVGGVLGSLLQPDALIVGCRDARGRLHVSGRTTPLSPAAQSAMTPGARTARAVAPLAGHHPVEPFRPAPERTDHLHEGEAPGGRRAGRGYRVRGLPLAPRLPLRARAPRPQGRRVAGAQWMRRGRHRRLGTCDSKRPV